MKKFTFTLEPLLEVRKRKEDGVKLELGAKNREILKAKQEMLGLHDQLKDLQQSEKEQRKTNPDVQAMRHGVAFRNKLKLDMLAKGGEIDTRYHEADGIQKRLTHATRERRSIEIIGEHRRAEWKLAAARTEQKAADDVSQQGFIRKRKIATARQES